MDDFTSPPIATFEDNVAVTEGAPTSPESVYQRRHKHKHRISFRSTIPPTSPSTSLVSVSGRTSSGSASLQAFPFHGSLIRATLRKSTRLVPGTIIEKPWLLRPDRASRAKWLIYGAWMMGMGLAGMICYFFILTVPHVGNLCPVLMEDFSSFNASVWQHEVQVGGFGNGEFEWTTTASENSFVQDGQLYIVPTLTNDVLSQQQILNGYTLNLTADGTCTSDQAADCVVSSNSSLATVINPVRSARLTTKLSKGIKYGKVEVTAKMPKGDWIWPAIWMLPTNSVYGEWPKSGEIDLAETRGNNMSYGFNGRNTISSSLHWGPNSALDRWYWTTATNALRRDDYSNAYHTFGMEWTDQYMMTYIDSRVQQLIRLNFSPKTFWQRGMFPSTIANASAVIPLIDPWVTSPNKNAPFDQEFYLILSVAVGGTNGWFPDGLSNKPWFDQDTAARADFFNTTSQWYPSWATDPKERGMAVQSVKMWQKC